TGATARDRPLARQAQELRGNLVGSQGRRLPDAEKPALAPGHRGRDPRKTGERGSRASALPDAHLPRGSSVPALSRRQREDFTKKV
ncbi:Hypothetical predicted protein, partial [Marmota monax]